MLVISLVVSEMVVDFSFAVFSAMNRFNLGPASFCRSLADLSEPDCWEPQWSYIGQCGDYYLFEESSDHVSTCFILVKKEPMWTYWMLFHWAASLWQWNTNIKLNKKYKVILSTTLSLCRPLGCTLVHVGWSLSQLSSQLPRQEAVN